MVPKAHQRCIAVFTRDRFPYWCFTLCSIFQKAKENRELQEKKAQELVQDFREQRRHYLPIQNITYNISMKIWDKDEEEKREEENFSLYKSETNFCKMCCGLIWYKGQCWEKHRWVYMFATFLSMIIRYIATFCDLKKETKKFLLYFSSF